VRIDRLRRKYIAFRKAYPDLKPVAMYRGRETWTEIPGEFTTRLHLEALSPRGLEA
jgi:hypothetical protein